MDEAEGGLQRGDRSADAPGLLAESKPLYARATPHAMPERGAADARPVDVHCGWPRQTRRIHRPAHVHELGPATVVSVQLELYSVASMHHGLDAEPQLGLAR